MASAYPRRAIRQLARTPYRSRNMSETASAFFLSPALRPPASAARGVNPLQPTPFRSEHFPPGGLAGTASAVGSRANDRSGNTTRAGTACGTCGRISRTRQRLPRLRREADLGKVQGHLPQRALPLPDRFQLRGVLGFSETALATQQSCNIIAAACVLHATWPHFAGSSIASTSP